MLLEWQQPRHSSRYIPTSHLTPHTSHLTHPPVQALHQQARIVELQHLADGLQQRLQEQEQQLAS